MPKNGFVCDCTVVHADAVDSVKKSMYNESTIRNMAVFFKMMGDETRAKILCALGHGELCVCDIASLLSMTKSAVSHQLALLRATDLVRFRKDGKTVFYSIADSHVYEIITAGAEHVSEKRK